MSPHHPYIFKPDFTRHLEEILTNNTRHTDRNLIIIEEESLQQLRLHGVTSLYWHLIHNHKFIDSMPTSFITSVSEIAKKKAAAELATGYELKRVLSTLAEVNIFPLILKGSALAYSLYQQPHHRHRCDTDLLFKNRNEAENAYKLLSTSGYRRTSNSGGEILSHEFSCHKRDRFSLLHNLDMHWKASNTKQYGSIFSYDELKQESVALPKLGAYAQGLGLKHALMLACIHRAATMAQGDANRLIWLYDIHLLSQSFNDELWQELIIDAKAKNISGVLLDGLQKTKDTISIKVAGNTLRQLQTNIARSEDHPKGSQQRWRYQLSDFRALPDWSSRLKLLKEHLLPDTKYILSKYNSDNILLLPYFYTHRIFKGVSKQFYRPKN